MTEDEMVGWHYEINGHVFEQTWGDSEDREAWCAAAHGAAEDDMTERLDNNPSKSLAYEITHSYKN